MPIVPIVIRNSGEVYWRNSILVRPGSIQVAVLPPIDVSAWDFENLDPHIEQVREQFADTLLNWPTD